MLQLSRASPISPLPALLEMQHGMASRTSPTCNSPMANGHTNSMTSSRHACIIAHFVTNTPIPSYWKTEMQRYPAARANPVDGGWGLRIEGKSTVLGIACNYIVLRMNPDHPVARKARGRLHKHGEGPSITERYAA